VQKFVFAHAEGADSARARILRCFQNHLRFIDLVEYVDEETGIEGDF
jgi:hypothetical protein